MRLKQTWEGLQDLEEAGAVGLTHFSLGSSIANGSDGKSDQHHTKQHPFTVVYPARESRVQVPTPSIPADCHLREGRSVGVEAFPLLNTSHERKSHSKPVSVSRCPTTTTCRATSRVRIELARERGCVPSVVAGQRGRWVLPFRHFSRRSSGHQDNKTTCQFPPSPYRTGHTGMRLMGTCAEGVGRHHDERHLHSAY